MTTSRFTTSPAFDRDSTAWWEALGRHELPLQRCSDCAQLRWPPREICGACGSGTWDWIPSRGSGTIASWNVTWQAVPPATPVPFVVVLVRLDDQPDILIPGSFDGAQDGRGLQVGLPVRAGFVDLEDTEPPVALLHWRAITDQGAT